MIELTLIDVALGLGLIAIAIGLSVWQRVNLAWPLAMATGRMILQLIVLAYVLDIVFAANHPVAVLAFALALLAIGAVVARNRISQKIPRLLPIVAGSLLVGTALALAYSIFFVIRPTTWYDSQYWLPLIAIVLGNALNSAAIAGQHLNSSLQSQTLDIETHLCLGATPQQALAPYRKEAVRTAVSPTLNSMMMAGLATLPGFLNGELISGVNPLDAIAYQILVLLMLAFSTLLTSLLVTAGISRQFFNSAAQLQRF